MASLQVPESSRRALPSSSPSPPSPSGNTSSPAFAGAAPMSTESPAAAGNLVWSRRPRPTTSRRQDECQSQGPPALPPISLGGCGRSHRGGGTGIDQLLQHHEQQQ